MLLTIIMFGLGLFGCNSENKEINVEFLYKDGIFDIKILKDSKINYNELKFISNKNDIILLYGKNYEMKYNNDVLNEDTTMMAFDYNGTEKLGKLYTLKEAYEANYISHKDLMDIYNNYLNFNEKLTLDIRIKFKILNDMLVLFKENLNNDAKLEDFSIYGYYGNYNNSYVIRLSDTFSDYPAVIERLKIDDIVFEYSGPSFSVWVNE